VVLLEGGGDVIDRQDSLAFIAIGIDGGMDTCRSGDLSDFAASQDIST
jgi:hypothetical protein